MAYTDIDDPTIYFNTKLYAGNSTDNTAITGIGFQPDLVWIRNRSITENHQWQDAVRGATGGEYYFLQSNETAGDQTQGDGDGVVSLDSDGFTLGYTNSTGWNQSGSNYVSWNWLAGNGTASNTDGSITSTVSANTTSGFSIATYTGNNTNAQTIGHGLGVAPKVYIIKRRDSTSAWGMYHGSLGANKYLQLESTNSEATDTGIWNNTAPTSSVLSIGNAGYFNNASGGTYVCYAFAEKKGFSKFGSYTGNGSTDGTFVYTGFSPAWVLWKKTSSATGGDWVIMDNKRSTSFNPLNKYLFADKSSAEGTATIQDFTSNGFKFRLSDNTTNSSGATYIYMAFAENPFVTSTGIPTTAR